MAPSLPEPPPNGIWVAYTMPAYLTAPPAITNRIALLPGKIGYSFGYDQGLADCRMSVTNVAISSNVATLTVQILEGPIPVVGAVSLGGVSYTAAPLVTVRGTKTATSAGGSNFNVTGATLASVSINLSTGAGTITYALTASNVATTSDAGLVVVPAYTLAETLPSSATAGQQFSVARGNLSTDGQRGVTWFTQFTGSPATVTANLQAADIDADANYTTVDTSTATGGESRSVGSINYSFYRVKFTSTGGTSPTCAAGIQVR